MIDCGNVAIKDVKIVEPTPEQAKCHVKNLHILDPMLEKVNNKIIEAVQKHPESVMVTVGGDHSVGSATLHALQTIYKDLKVIWVDAHPDLIDPTQS